ncbi:MAG TPA: flagellar hook-basal body complex protein FliE [Stellaceae bacterium]|nr:flagellar hook-basal body complex protein FliE [Stellaceae bacterium]
MAVNMGSAVNAYANAARIAGNGASQGPAKAGGESFGKMMQDAAGSVMDTLGKGEQASLQAVTGNADLASVTQAVTDAQIALQTVVAVRDRVISAYQDIIKMPI